MENINKNEITIYQLMVALFEQQAEYKRVLNNLIRVSNNDYIAKESFPVYMARNYIPNLINKLNESGTTTRNAEIEFDSSVFTGCTLNNEALFKKRYKELLHDDYFNFLVSYCGKKYNSDEYSINASFNGLDVNLRNKLMLSYDWAYETLFVNPNSVNELSEHSFSENILSVLKTKIKVDELPSEWIYLVNDKLEIRSDIDSLEMFISSFVKLSLELEDKGNVVSLVRK